MAVLVTGEKLEILITEAEIASRINTLSEQISKAYEQTDQLVVIGLLRGSIVFIADLVRCLDLPVEVDFMTVSSYGNKMKSSGQLRIIKDVETDLKNRDVLIIEDIIDTGHTLSQVVSLLEAELCRQPSNHCSNFCNLRILTDCQGTCITRNEGCTYCHERKC